MQSGLVSYPVFDLRNIKIVSVEGFAQHYQEVGGRRWGIVSVWGWDRGLMQLGQTTNVVVFMLLWLWQRKVVAQDSQRKKIKSNKRKGGNLKINHLLRQSKRADPNNMLLEVHISQQNLYLSLWNGPLVSSIQNCTRWQASFHQSSCALQHKTVQNKLRKTCKVNKYEREREGGRYLQLKSITHLFPIRAQPVAYLQKESKKRGKYKCPFCQNR